MNFSTWGSQYPVLDIPFDHDVRAQPRGDWASLVLNEPFAIPFMVASASLCIHTAHTVLRYAVYRWKSPSDEADARNGPTLRPVDPTTAYYLFEQRKDKNGNSIFGYTLARLFGCLTLSILSTKTLLTCSTLREHGTLSLRHIFSRCPEAFITVSLLYCLILALISMTGTKWATSARRHNIFILLSIMGVYLYRDIWPLATFDEDPKDSNDKLIWYKIATLTFTSVVVPLFIPRRYIPMDPKDPMPVPNDEQTCSIAALILYSFLDPVILLGYREKHMKPEQLPPLSDTDWTKNLVRHAFPHLDPYSGSKRRHLFFGLLRVFRKEYCFMGISIIAQVVLSFFSPIGVNRILRYLESGGIGATIRPWFWILCIFVGPTLNSIAFQGYIFLATRSLARTEAIITQLVFEHSLRIRFIAETGQEGNKDQARNHDVTPTEPPVISPAEASNEEETAVPHDSGASAVSNETLTAGSTKGESKDDPKADAPKQSNLIGKLNNLVTTDLDNIVDSRDFLLPTLEAPLQIIASTVFLYTMLGWSAFVGIGLMVILLPVPGYAAKLQDKVQGERMEKTDARVQDITEVLGFIRMIKLFGWEEKMSKKIKEKRDEELSAIWRYKILEMVASVAGSLIPYVIMIATFATFTLFMKQSLTASIIFPSVTVFSMIRLQLGTFTWQVSTSIQGKVSLDRLSDFLSTTELLDSFGDDGPAATTTVPDNRKQEIGFKNTVFSWRVESEDGTLTPSRRSYRLRIDELFFKPNCINLIVGPTGSGKTSILMALLGEMHCIHPQADSWFNLPREGGVAYAAQESWVQNTTIRDNILFGSIYNEERYRKVIQQCALERDLELFEAGDSTEVGEKGVTLSGGQKARITLARAIYSPAQILLLDDILAALDVHTSAWIVNQCLRGDLVKGRTVLLVTHNVALAAPIAGFIVSLSSDGTVKTQGSDSETILANDPTFVEEMEHNLEEIKVADEEVPALAPKETSGAGKLIIAEEIVEGHVTWKPIKLFLTALGGQHPVLFFVPLLVSLVVSIGMWTSQSWFLGYWGSQYETHDPAEVNVSRYLSLYSAIVLGTLILDYGSHIFYIYGTMRASRTINAVLVDSVLSSTLRWLDETPISRIIARCTRDIRAIDGPLAQGFFNLVSMALAMVNNLAVIFIFTPVFLFPGLGVAGAGLFLGNMYLKAQLSVKRETSNARAPVIAHFGTAMSGIVSVRAYGAQTPFKTELLKRLDYYLRVSKMSYNLNRWIGIRIDLIGNLFTAALATYLVYGTFIGSSNTGFSLNLVVEFCSTILYWVRMFNDFEVQSNSLERVQGYLDIEHEPKPTEEGKPPAAWPTSGDIVVDNLTARYSETGPAVLHGLSFHIKSGERVGVVGRTGSGKSSLTLALLRCILTEGTVYYDGIPTNKVNLDALRSNITIIPQTPELISGTLRRNLDPFEQYDDAVLNDALRSAGLFAVHNEEHDGRITLDSSISSGGGNLSVGEKQIIALARAMVRGSKLLILDEATSAIDYKTDSVIQTTLRHKLDAGVTVVTVAHRLQTIMDADKIMVLDSGRIAEFDSPRALLQKADGMFRALVDGSGDKEALYDMASNATKPVASSS